jgi:hypothetical protein
MDFLIGYEFEFGWEPVDKVTTPKKSKNIPKLDYFEQFILLDVKSSLKKFLVSQYKSISGITDDPSIKFNKNFRQGHFGVEVITKPLEEKESILLLKNILIWLQQTPNIITNDTCALHVNISCIDKKHNKKLDYFSILHYTPQKQILKKFNRIGNLYCQSTFTRKFPLNANNRRTITKTFDKWISKIYKDSISVTTYEFSNFKLDGQKKRAKIFFPNKKEAYEMIKTTFLSALGSVDKNIAVVEKWSPTKKRYFEFRMIGNTNYEYKEKEILSCIEQFKKSLQNSISNPITYDE